MSIIGNLRQAQASMTGDNFVTEITTAPFGVDCVDTDSEGRVFVLANNDVWRSLDQGATWTKVLDMPHSAPDYTLLIYVAENDYIYADMYNQSGVPDYYLYRSIDHGDTWTKVLHDHAKCWEMDEMTNGSLFMNTYATDHNWIYSSTDGSSWAVFSNLTELGWSIDHIHAVAVDDYTDEIYIVTGDGANKSLVARWNTTTTDWDIIANSSTVAVEWQMTKVMFDETYVYFLCDGQVTNYRMLKNGTSYEDFRAISDVRWGGLISSNFVFGFYHRENDVYLYATDDGQLWGSWDGEHWVKVFDLNEDEQKFFDISHRRPLYMSNMQSKKLYKIDVTKEDIIQLYYTQHTQYRGYVTNAENYIVEQRLWNGTNYLDLTKVGLTNVTASIKGLSRTNYAPSGNSGFELGTKTGWSEGGAPSGAIDSVTKHAGSYSFNISKSSGDTYVSTLCVDSYINGSQGDIYALSFYYKANDTVAEAMGLYLQNGTGTVKKYLHLTSPTEWTRYTVFFPLDSPSSSAHWRFKFRKKDVTHWIDSILMLKLEVGTARCETADESFSYFEGFASVVGTATVDSGCGYCPIDYFDGVLNSSNPTLTIDNQTVSHSGTLTNGTESSGTALTGTITGGVQVLANIQGSGQAILKSIGTRVLFEDSMILEGRKDDVYYGRYYGTFSPTINTDDLVVVTNLASSITSLSYSFNKLSLTIASPSNMTSINKVYCGITGEPIAIYTANGTQTWSYNASTTILTLNITHKSPSRITIYWKLPGDTDSDGDVDIYDLYILAVAYGSHVDEPNYNSNSDIDSNNHVYFDDLCILAGDYGELKP